MDASQIWNAVQTIVTAVLAYLLKDKHDKLNRLEERVAHLELTQAVQDESYKHVNARMDSIDKKLDRLLEIATGDKS